ncbi:hypothetical protein P4O66_000218 [Electrophorus voltai]|uniref:APC membrane recruitment protein 2-like n=1 Tax=Electrophorus voltai TaxID=2609070 RepID=A0AAD9E0V8_9TELE|nr:hypothetical protein P4O66_000218 [Electrophorus voltai]
MDAQSESCEPPLCDPQPPGKIRKALKLFSKRRPGSGMANIFSMRSKGEGGPKSPPSRSKTLDGLTEAVAPEAEAESMDLDQEACQKEDSPMDEPTSREGNLGSTPTRQSISSITSAKSLSFLNMLRWSRKGGEGERQTQTESQRAGRQRKGLKGLFGSVRWHGKDSDGSDQVAPGPPLLASRSNSVEIIKENLTLTPRPPPRSPDGSESEQQPPVSQDVPTCSEDTTKVSETAKLPINDRLSTLLGDISSILSFDSLTGGGDIVADVEAEWMKVSSRVEGRAGTDEAVRKDKALSAAISAKLKPTLSPTSTSFSKPSSTSTAKPISSFTTPPKPIPSPTTKPRVSPPSSPSPSTSTKPVPFSTCSPTHIPTKKPDQPSETSPFPSSSPSMKPMSIAITKSPPTTPTYSAEPSLTHTFILTPEPSTTPTPTPTPTSTPTPTYTPTPSPVPAVDSASAATTETSISPTVESPAEPSPAAVITEPTPTPTAATKPTPTPAPPLITKPIHSAAQETRHSSASASKYPPFNTSIKPVSTGPINRPKIITTFGLSTSRNTAPIVKPETKQSAPQPKLSPPLLQTDKGGSVSAMTKASTSESGPPHYAPKPPPATSPPSYAPSMTKPQALAAAPASSSATSVKPTHKVEHTSLPYGPPSTLIPFPDSSATAPKRDREQEDVASRRGMEETGVHIRPQKLKTSGLSKIPVSGGGRPKQYHRDAHSNGDEGHWNLPTPVHEEESPISLSRESSSKEALSDFSTGSGAVTPTLSHNLEDILDSAVHPTVEATSLARESKIPIKHGSTATYHPLQGKTETTRSKIPVSKVPVRRTSNKPAPSAAAVRK